MDGGYGQVFSIYSFIAILIILTEEGSECLLVRSKGHQIVGDGLILPGQLQEGIIVLRDGLIILRIAHDPLNDTGEQVSKSQGRTVITDREDQLSQFRGIEQALAFLPILYDVQSGILCDLADAIRILIVEDTQYMILGVAT